MKLYCPACARPLEPEQINLQTDLALCRACGELSRPSALDPESPEEWQTGHPPPAGAWHRAGMGEDVYGATTRHPVAFMLVPFTLVWGGGSMGGLYGTQIASGTFNPLLFFFGLPFLVGTIVLTSLAAMATAGRVELRLRGTRAEIFTGVGPLGWRRRVELSDFERVSIESAAPSRPGAQGQAILLAGRERVRFGAGLSDARLRFLFAGLRAAHRSAQASARR
jgi:hypothetical protein